MGTYAGIPYLVTELLDGKTLTESIRRGPLPFRKAIEYGVQIARGLAAAHEKGIVHRDLKPDNLFVTKDGRVKILDFGLAKLIQPKDSPANLSPTITMAGVAMGTVGYMSPEQVRGVAVDHRSDIFALGAILYEMVMGRQTFQRPTSADTMSAILNEDPGPYFRHRSGHTRGVGEAGAPLSGKESRAAISVRLRSCLRTGSVIGSHPLIAKRRLSHSERRAAVVLG